MHDHKDDHVHTLYTLEGKYEPNPQESSIHIHNTDGAIAASFAVDIVAGNEVEKVISEEMQKLAQWVNDQGGIIGHIKAKMTVSKPTVFLSITSDVLQRKIAAENHASIGLAAIVFNVDQKELRKKISSIFQRLTEFQAADN
ncbi:hypothetical protein LPY66_02050 [Dehalobacter sp. DCM]|uniref:hypothetical protein n=1 Tax=Dehalobacter sp. DCM TaxID=2907827 RepID=UPI0030815DA7|nr:hypothetical protein LPY66_02050 [Dehalobacter sp. DCM]